MSRLFEGIARRALFTLDPEAAHGLSIKALKSGMVPGCSASRDPRLATTVAGLSFPNPLGMAAGYDKNAEVCCELAHLGFGFVEVGTLTPRPQTGNPKPRIFRLVKDHAVINRLGFNNEGHATAHARISGRRHEGLLGVNIGANKDTEDRAADYVAGISQFADVADYFTVNISSPNTPGLRNLQTRASLSELLGRVLAERDAKPRRIPVFLKIAPDLGDPDLDDIASECLAQNLDGIIVSNTTLSRTGLSSDPRASEAGGLSGRPVFERSTIVLAKMRQRLGPDMPLVGVGGIDSAETAAEKMRAGADLIQLYTGFIYGGPLLPGRILRGLSKICDRDKLVRLSDLRDSRTAHYAGMTIPD
ncbi:MAG: quinone-dependent dihydroorotate dehydrogenase [Hoeflea sp.]|uniref:quinone-dependent dihydroorotate dehydrogenase n=1 Tax=Hoeflea sp. TaxID=1940281 RepID=UPI001DCFC8BB|nr:quinone-dependent dihydroorotate dehydrogenase [Hoeflea sp.]MBU4531199.1 quinone-dependent dihydroorotate dehydrogenase [Alphaproteobacteria bacterium]MBU4545739.1 quinone-dependent dihydroorotate dehydrogenase [Alphaproteobacteria bacterium]MBU4550708.1 quinone-dependent dihydroorotate dehydrogenase [Alphaproteobacteria bacterium]MBV1724476.1 quinone-dependent dihydroorotate dehydrogenase [Hoeflea sp.]MBV1760496.1 quinone-dependent dihydroorotate dehydrogenase [Hoeflea sp.]